MKKLLTIFSSISLITMTSATAIACSNNNKKEDKQSTATETTDNKKSKEMDKNQTSSPTSTNMNNNQGSNSSATTNMSTQPKEEAFWKNEPLIFSEADYVSEYFKRKEHIAKTSELVLDNSEGIKGRMENSTPENMSRDLLAETQDLILKNSNSLMSSTR
ncbi:lipoprotein [Mycoplasma mycoides]|uniref:lipoprotein n=1 Tax=Mycoplasma mycoides TaxID=2102 RepID=UPI00223FC48E|nr:lipoprotein [Mycoplasma mycoides]QVK05952.1 lipoprotein [Mycoplasma mycoides subsp. capri]QVK08466.1 lipoprotein [Mycoplasma mycoides subsp. capri]